MRASLRTGQRASLSIDLAAAPLKDAMPIDENQLNGRIATLLGRMSTRWTARGESKGAFAGSQKQPDILVIQPGAQPVVIENEYQPARTVEAEALARLGESLDPSVVDASGMVSATIALRSSEDLRNCVGADDVDTMLAQGVTLEYALFTGPSPVDAIRFPQTGFIAGNIRDLASFTMRAATPEDAVQRAVEILEQGVQDAAALLREAVDLSDDTDEKIARHLKQPYGPQTLRMAATIIVNALVFHAGLAGRHGVKSFKELEKYDILLLSDLLREWRRILTINYWSIFSIAHDLLRSINPPRQAAVAFHSMRATAEQLVNLGVSQSHDLTGTVFQRLIADRKFLATFYTRPESAVLLAHLAIPDDDRWHDPERVKNFRIADYACGTGTLIHAAYRRVNQLHWLAGGKPEQIHAHMMEHSLTACDVLPSAVHLTASMLSSTHPTEMYDGSRTIVTQYGKTEHGGVSLGSLDLLGSNGIVRPLIPLHRGTAVTGTGETQAQLDVDMPPFSQDLVIMNPPFTRPGSDWEGEGRESDYVKQFRGLRTDLDTQTKMAAQEKEYTRGTCAHGFAGIASSFVAVANRMVKKSGTLALVLPMTSLQGSSWRKVREMIARGYRDVVVLTIASAQQHDQSFSADTGIAETLVVCHEDSRAPAGRGLFVSLRRRPRSEMEAMELARAIAAMAASPATRTLEDGPFGGQPLEIGREQLGEAIGAPLSKDEPWSAVGIADFSVPQTAFQVKQGRLWLPQMKAQDALPLPMATIQKVCEVGINHNNIVGKGGQTAFTILKPPSGTPTYPMLWNHDAGRERQMVVNADSEGRVKPGREGRADDIWDTRSHAHHNADFRFNSQPLAVAFTETQTIGGTAWKNVKFDSRTHEVAHTLWGNTTLGLLCYWWHSTRQQAGRGRIPIEGLRSMPVLDVTKLSPQQLATAETIFDDMRERKFLPANEAYRDNSRKELDYRVLIEVLGLPERVMEPLALLRLKWCSEPSVHGGKSTAPPNV